MLHYMIEICNTLIIGIGLARVDRQADSQIDCHPTIVPFTNLLNLPRYQASQPKRSLEKNYFPIKPRFPKQSMNVFFSYCFEVDLWSE